MEALCNVLQILGREPITKHTRTPPTEELPQPQLNIWGISLAKHFPIGKCWFVETKAFCGKTSASMKYWLGSSSCAHSTIAWQNQTDTAFLLGFFCTAIYCSQTDQQTDINTNQKGQPLMWKARFKKCVWTWPFPLGYHHMGRVLIPVSESFFKITGLGTLFFCFKKEERKKEKKKGKTKPKHINFSWNSTWFPLSSFNINDIIVFTLGIW